MIEDKKPEDTQKPETTMQSLPQPQNAPEKPQEPQVSFVLENAEKPEASGVVVINLNRESGSAKE